MLNRADRTPPTTGGGWFARHRWQLALLLITAGGLAARALYSEHTPQPGPIGDPGFYHDTARALADGLGYIAPHAFGLAGPTAEHPPLYSLLVAAITALGGTGEATQPLVASLVPGAL